MFLSSGGGVVSAASGINIVSPNGGENLNDGVDITWDLTGTGTGLIAVMYSSNAGDSWTDLATLAPGSIGYDWKTISKSDGDGTNYLIYVIESDTNVYDVSDAVFTIDNTIPTSSASVEDYQNSLSFDISFTVTDANPDSVELFYKKDSGSWTSYGTGTFTLSPISFDSSTTGGDGVYGFYTIATDKAGNTESSKTTADDSTTVDNVKPSTTDDYTLTGWQTSYQTITLTPTDASPSSGIASTKYCVDTDSCELNTDYTEAVTISTEGTNYFRYASTDNAGNIQDTISKTVMIDTIEPTIALTYSVNPSKAGDMIITATYSEAVTGTPQIDIDQPGTEDITAQNMVVTAGSDNKIWTYTYIVHSATETGYVDGTATVSLSVVVDVAGNSASSPTGKTFIIDTTNPSIDDITNPTDDLVTGDSISLTYDVTEINPHTCYYKIDADYIEDSNCGTATTISGLSEGRRIIIVKVEDDAGNSDTKEVNFVVDTDNILTVDDSGNPDFSTIQSAIDKATSGNTISVADGTYIITEAINVNEKVTITGNIANPENVLVKYDPASSTLNCVEVNSADVTIQGIKVQDCKNGFHFDRSVNTNTGVTISSCIVESVSGWGIGEISSPNTVISHNTITTAGDKGIYFRLCEGTSELNRCEAISNTISGCGESAIQTYFSKYAYIYDNTISSTNDKGINIIRSGATGTADRVQVIGNTISETKWPGIQVIGAPYTYVYDNILTKCNYYGLDETGDWDYASIHVQDDIGPTYSNHVIIDNNIVSDGINGIQTWSNDVTITNNEIYDMGKTYADTKTTGDGTYKNSGILVGSMYGDDPTGIVITNNNLHDNYWGLFYKAGLINGVTAENNYWGTAYKQTIQGMVSENVVFEPYYVDAVGGILSTDAVSTVYVDNDYSDGNAEGHIFGYDAFDKIQDGINAVDENGIVDVAAGTYNEALTINKQLTIQGADKTTTIIDGENMLATAVNIQASDVTFQHFTVKNFKSLPDNYIGAILVEGDNAVINDNIIMDITSNTDDPAGIGIDVHANGVNVTNNTVYDVGSQGIRVRHTWNEAEAPTESNNVLLDNNEVYRTANTNVIVTGHAKGVTITNNKIYESLEPTPYSLIINMGATDVTVEDNDIRDGAANIIIMGSWDITIKNNVIADAIPHYSDPTNLKGKNIYIRSNTWYASPQQTSGVLSKNIEIFGNNITGSTGEGILILDVTGGEITASTTTINNNNITGNTEYGVENLIATNVDAKNNWWGHVTGPYSSSSNTDSNTDGEGNDVSDNVLINPWSINEQHDTDLTAPTSEITSPNAGSWQNQGFTVEFNYSDMGGSGLKKCKYKVVSNDVITKSYNTGDCDCSSDSILISKLITMGSEQNCKDEGTNICKVVIKAFDNANNEGTEFSRTFSIDWTAPTDGSVSYTNGYETDTTATITVNEGTDSVSGIASVQLSKKEATLTGNTCGAFGDWATYGTQSTGTTSVDVTTESGKCYMFKYESTNGAGLTATSTSVNELKVDADAPTISDNYASDGVWVNSDQTITLNPQDAIGGIKEVKYCEGTDCTPNIVLSNPYQLSYTTTQNTIVRYQAWDNADNPSAIGGYNVKIDKEFSTTEDNSDTNWHADDKTITLTRTDTGGSGIAHTYYCVYNEGGTVCTPNIEGTSVSVTCSADSVCNQIVKYYSVDNAGNEETADNSNIVKIDKKAPSIDSVTSDVTIQADSSIQINATVSDSGSGVDSVILHYNDGTEHELIMEIISGSIYNATIPAQSDNVTITYYVTATDNVGKVATSLTYTVTVHDLIWDLASDWNLVSVPKTLVTNTTNTLLLGSAAWEHDGTSWVRPDKISAGVGYWVDNANKTELGLDYAEESIGGSVPSGTIDIGALQGGWNLIGLTTTNSTKTVENVFVSEITGDTIPAFYVYGYNEEADKFTSLTKTDFMNPGEGYWVYINK